MRCEGRAAIEAVRGAGEEPHAHLAARQAHGLHVALHLHGRAPLVAIAHQHADLGRAHAGIEELVAAPGIGGEHGRQPAPRADAGSAKRRVAAVSTAEPPRLCPCAPMRPASISLRALSTFQAASTS